MISIAAESPLGADLGLLMARHTADMHADTPPESIHMMDAGQLARPGIEFFVMRDNGVPVAMGAFKRIDAAMPRSSRCMCWPRRGAVACRAACWTI
jgi:putative acetyltransferase